MQWVLYRAWHAGSMYVVDVIIIHDTEWGGEFVIHPPPPNCK